eukprot:scaffold32421_cov48-Phaeocystis_antarctica.AAC.1
MARGLPTGGARRAPHMRMCTAYVLCVPGDRARESAARRASATPMAQLHVHAEDPNPNHNPDPNPNPNLNPNHNPNLNPNPNPSPNPSQVHAEDLGDGARPRGQARAGVVAEA